MIQYNYNGKSCKKITASDQFSFEKPQWMFSSLYPFVVVHKHNVLSKNKSLVGSSFYVFSGVNLLVESKMAIKKCKFRPVPDVLLSEGVIVAPLSETASLDFMSYPQ